MSTRPVPGLVSVAVPAILILFSGCDEARNPGVSSSEADPPAVLHSDAIIHLSEKDFERQIEDGVVLVDFYADWCGPCKMMEPHFIAVAEAFKDRMRFAKVDVDRNRQLYRSFASQGIPTLVVFEDGQPVRVAVGARPENQIRELVESVLQKRAKRLAEERVSVTSD